MHKPIYEDIVKIGHERKDASFLDIGYCCGASHQDTSHLSATINRHEESHS